MFSGKLGEKTNTKNTWIQISSLFYNLSLAVTLLIYLYLQWQSKIKLFSVMFKVFYVTALIFSSNFLRWKFCLCRTFYNIDIISIAFITYFVARNLSTSQGSTKFIISFLNFCSEILWHLFMLIILIYVGPNGILSCIIIFLVH